MEKRQQRYGLPPSTSNPPSSSTTPTPKAARSPLAAPIQLVQLEEKPSDTICSESASTCPKKYKALKAKRKRTVCSIQKSVGLAHPDIWHDLRNSGTLCDGKLKSSEGEEFAVHIPLICANSPKLRHLFTNASKRREDTKIVLCDVPAEALKTYLDFVYTGQCEINAENVHQVLPFAEHFNVYYLLQQCSKFLQNETKVNNCIKIFKLAKLYFCPDLVKQARHYVLHNFNQVIDTADFVKFTFEELEDILRDDHLNVPTEETVFAAVKKWIEYNPAQREALVVELLQTIRFGLLTYQFFTQVVLQWRFVKDNVTVQQALYEPSLFLVQLDSRNNGDVDLNDPLARPRIPYEIVFSIGGWSAGSPTNFVETYDARADRWFISNTADTIPRAYHGLIALDHLIYMIGGFDGHDHFNTVRCFNTLTQEWAEKACMYYSRCYVSCCQLDGQIYALGGYNGRGRMSSVEKYSPAENQWRLVTPMNRQRSDACACSLNGKVYIAGGFNGQEVLNSVEVYDPVENQWTFIHAMRSARSGVSLMPYRGCLYAIGGFNGFSRLNSVEKYDPAKPGEWTSLTDMTSPRSNFASVIVDDKIFVLGGFNGTTTIPYVESYDASKNEWSEVAHMNLNRSALNACVVRGLRNGKKYSFLSRVEDILGVSSAA